MCMYAYVRICILVIMKHCKMFDVKKLSYIVYRTDEPNVHGSPQALVTNNPQGPMFMGPRRKWPIGPQRFLMHKEGQYHKNEMTVIHPPPWGENMITSMHKGRYDDTVALKILNKREKLCLLNNLVRIPQNKLSMSGSLLYTHYM